MNLLETVVDLDAIAANTELLKRLVFPAQLMCVVKADGYNHGIVEVAQVMVAHGADQLGVATLAEAQKLRAAGITVPILCWIWSPEQDFIAAIENNIDLAVISVRHAEAIVAEAVRRNGGMETGTSGNAAIRVCIKVDTGLHRSGVDEAQWQEVFALLNMPGIMVTGVMSHLACADDVSDEYTNRQADAFRRAIACGRAAGLALPVNHLCNSPGTLTRPDLYFDMVRPGLAAYGLEPIAGLAHRLQPAMRWEAAVTVVKPIKAGQGVSYSLTWHAPTDGFIAVIPCGYADGLPRNAQSQVEVTIAGRRYPQVGRICMDQFVVFLSDNPAGVTAGDRAIIFGPGGMSAQELAYRLDDISYAIVCRPGGRTVRRFEGRAAAEITR
ncbi:MAG: alanine racemase [Corynebacterium sp.]|uniref:alanine racemase n=1 Tax=Corynebacterium sp. TaxID=1720 RepID=UPI0026DD9A4E|nr:alanine racemase [Corynebacterium sp.]MDO5099623.1 alanine racemase [Corynebacterium sp.]